MRCATASPAAPVRIPRFDKGRRYAPAAVALAARDARLHSWSCSKAGASASPHRTTPRCSEPINAPRARAGCGSALADRSSMRSWPASVCAALAADRSPRPAAAPGLSTSCRAGAKSRNRLCAGAVPRRPCRRAGSASFSHIAERLSRHALATLPERADLIVELDEERKVTCVSPRTLRAASRERTGRY